MALRTGRLRSNCCSVGWSTHLTPLGNLCSRGGPDLIMFSQCCHSFDTVRIFLGQQSSEPCKSLTSALVRRRPLGHRRGSFSQSDGHSGCVVWGATLLVRIRGTGLSTLRRGTGHSNLCCLSRSICFCLLDFIY